MHYVAFRIMPTSVAKPAWEAVIAAKEITMRKVDGWKTLSEKSSASSAQLVDLAA